MKSREPKWHLFYYLLAGIDLITIACSLSLTHKILSIYENSVVINSDWVSKADRYELISEAAGNTNAPGNDVFDSHDVKGERAKMQKAFYKFTLLLKDERDSLSSIPNERQRKEILDSFTKVENAMNIMVDEAELIFGFFERNDSKKAGMRMATMDRAFAGLNTELRKLRGLVREYQKENLLNQQNEAHELAKGEYLIALTILLIVCGISFYGRMLSKKITLSNALIRNQQSNLESSARLASLGTMSAGIAHEINNPLSIIHGNATLLSRLAQKGQLTEEKIVSTTEKIVLTCTRITSIINGLRAFSRDGSKDPFNTVDVTQLLNESLAFCSERFKSHGVDLRLVAPEKSIEFECRKVQVSQILINLLNNAFDAIESMPNPWVEVSVEVSSNKIRLLVKDSGGGIPKDVLEKMMTPFFTTKEVGKGTGLGLSISHTIAAQHKGRLYVDENSPHTLFVLELPVVQNARQPEEEFRKAS